MVTRLYYGWLGRENYEMTAGLYDRRFKPVEGTEQGGPYYYVYANVQRQGYDGPPWIMTEPLRPFGIQRHALKYAEQLAEATGGQYKVLKFELKMALVQKLDTGRKRAYAPRPNRRRY
jgi:hypothetical protein